MAAKNQRGKGAANENIVRDRLTEWWVQVEPMVDDKPLVFARTPQSGGHHAAGELNMAGDLMTNSRLFPFSVEVKAREAWDVDRLLAGRASPVWGWWRQCITDSEKTGSVPMLWFKKNYKPWMVLIPLRYARSTRGVPCPDVVFPRNLSRERNVSIQPSLYYASSLLEVSPKVFAR